MASFFASIFLFFVSAICFISVARASNNGGITLDLIHDDSPHSLDNSLFTHHSRRLTPLQKTPEAIEAPITNYGVSYLIKFKIGNPPMDVTAKVSTSDDFTWIQCQPCTNCYKQDLPVLDPAKSSTFQRLPCNDSLCNFDDDYSTNQCDAQNHCQYNASLAYQEFTEGILGRDTFLFESPSGGKSSIPGVTFGCSQNSVVDADERISGVFGGGALSIARLYGEKAVNGAFSYCLTGIGSNGNSKITFGRPASLISGPGVMKTPLITHGTNYYITFVGMSIGDKRIGPGPRPRPAPVPSGGGEPLEPVDPFKMMVDTDSYSTYISRDLYFVAENALLEVVKAEPAFPTSAYSVCFLANSTRGPMPQITMHFEGGVDLKLSESQAFLRIKDNICWAFIDDTGNNARLGTMHQTNYVIGYDLDGNEISFLPADCSRRQ